MTKGKQTDYDSPWKQILRGYFKEFMAFFFPKAHAGIDWERGHEFLDKELQGVARKTKTGRRLVDKLVKVWRRDGEETWVLVHVEVQGQEEGEFARRMYIFSELKFETC